MLKEISNVFKSKSDPSDPDISEILSLIQTADEIPSTERIEALKEEFIALCQQAKKVLVKQDPQNKKVLSLDSLSPPGSEKEFVDWFVIGDLHCDFQSLCRILLKIYLRPNVDPTKVKIIFLGDYIDRGNRPFEVLKLILSLKVKLPDHFWLLKGNHETLAKGEDGVIYPSVTPADTIDFWRDYYGEETFACLAELFDLLPVAFIQSIDTPESLSEQHDHNVFYVHGGIPRTENLLLPLESPECHEAYLWSDPELEKDDVWNGPGRRFSFGRKDFLAFTASHHIVLMVRGHEVRRDGFDLHPELGSLERRIVTLHSCGGKDNEDSQYGAEILVPRFLHMYLDDSFIPRFSVEEVYRDDLIINGALFVQHPEYFSDLVEYLKSSLFTENGINLNVKALGSATTETDPSNILDTYDCSIRLSFWEGSDADSISYEVKINNHIQKGSFLRDQETVSQEISTLAHQIRDVYPIFGQTSTNCFNTLKEVSHG